ncbi:MAG: hypothetical protein RL148_1531 [Planctomycetota bacterium]
MSWRRIVLLTSLLLALLVATSWLVLQRSGATTHVARSLLERVLACAFELDAASIDLASGSLQLRGLRLMDPERDGVTLLAVDSLTVTVSTSPHGEIVSVHSVVVDGIALDLDIVDGRLPRVDQLLRARTGGGDGTFEVPPLEVHNGSARVAVGRDLPVLEFDRLELAVGRTGASDDVRLGGSLRLANLGLQLGIAGTATPDFRSARMAAGASPLVVDADLLARLQPFLGPELPAAGIGASLDAFDLWMELADDAVTAGFDARLHDVECTIPAVPYPVRGATLHIAGDTRDEGYARFRVERGGEPGDLVATGEVRSLFATPQLTLGARGRSLRIDEPMVAALQSFPAGANVVAALKPTRGTADLDLYLHHPGKDDEVVELDLHVRDADLAYHGFGRERRVGFPLPLTGVEGRVRLRNRDIQLHGIRARVAEAAGGGTIDVAGHVRLVRDADDEVSVDIESESIRFTPALRSALATLLRDEGRLYDSWQPDGTAAVSVRVRSESVVPGKWQAVVRPLGAEVRWSNFPLQVRDVQGSILVRNDGVRVDVTARHGDATVRVAGDLGHFQVEDASHPHLRMLARVEGMPCSSPLREALASLAPDTERTWSDLAPGGGRVDASVRVEQDRKDSAIRWDLAAAVRGITLEPAVVQRMPLREVSGTLHLSGSGQELRCHIDAAQAVFPLGEGREPQTVGLSGTVVRGSARTMDLGLTFRDLQLDDALAGRLDTLGIVSLESWRFLAPQGTAHAHVRIGGVDDAPVRILAEVDLVDVSSRAAVLPAPFTGVRGRLSADGNVLTFRDLVGTMAGAVVQVGGGSIGPAADDPTRRQIAFTVRSQSFPVDERIANLFQGPLREAVRARRPAGRADIQELSLRFLTDGPGAGQPTETVLAGRIEFVDLDFELGTRFEDLSGTVQVEESRMGGAGGMLRGSIRGASFRMFDHPFAGFDGGFRVDEERVQFDRLACEVHGGTLRGSDPRRAALAYRFPERNDGRGVLSFELDMANVSLGELLKSSGVTGSPYRGTLDGFLRLNSLTDGDFLDVDAQGQLAIEGGNLGTVPIFTAIYSQLDEKSRPRFDSGTLAFRARDRRVQVEQLVVRSPVIAVEGKGTMTLEGYLDITLALESLFQGSADMLLLPPLFKALTQQLVRFHLYGHLADIRVEQRWFAEGRPRRSMLPPVPPRTFRPVRPDF